MVSTKRRFQTARLFPSVFPQFISEMLIKGILPVISLQMQKCDFVFAYKSSTCVFDLAARPWAARKH